MAAEFEIVRGMVETMDCYIQNQSGAIVDLTGYSNITFYANKSLNAASPSISKAATSVAASAGFVSFAFASGDTESLATGEYRGEVKVTGIGPYTTDTFTFRIKQRVKA